MSTKENMLTCRCGEKIPVSSDLEATTAAIDKHLLTHKVGERSAINDNLCRQVLNKIQRREIKV